MEKILFDDIDNLIILINRASPEVAAGLLSRLDALKLSQEDKLPFAKLIEAARGKIGSYHGDICRIPGINRLFFEPFDSLFENSDINGILPGSVDRVNLAKIWEVVSTEIASDFYNEVKPKTKAAILEHNMGMARQYVATLRDKTVESILAKKDEYIFHKVDASIPKEQALRFASLLRVERLARKNNISLDVDIALVNDLSFKNYVNFLIDLDNRDLNLSSEYIVVLMANSTRPWSVLRLIKTAFKDINDRKLALTAYDLIGKRLFAKMRRLIDVFNDARTNNNFDGFSLAQVVEVYNQYNHGLSRENILSEGGPWKETLLELRKISSSVFNDICQRAKGNLENCLPLDRVKYKGAGNLDLPRTNHEVNFNKVNIANNYINFVNETRLYAPLAGFGAPREAALKDVMRHSDSLKSGMLFLARQQDRGKYYDQWVKATYDVTKAIDGETSAKLFSKQVAA